jgi:HEAT repeat protein
MNDRLAPDWRELLVSALDDADTIVRSRAVSMLAKLGSLPRSPALSDAHSVLRCR